MNKVDLKLDWCSTRAAQFACHHWHYLGTTPTSKTVKIGVWENGKFIGCVIFSRGSNYEIGAPFGLKQTEICELTRVALDKHVTPVSRILKIAIKMLREQSPGIRLIVSYADQERGHHGGIYAAGGWIYLGLSKSDALIVNGIRKHPRSVVNRYGTREIEWLRTNIDPNACRITVPDRHKYVFPIDDAMRKRLLPLAKPYPKRAGSADGGTPDCQSGRGGSIPTSALSRRACES